MGTEQFYYPQHWQFSITSLFTFHEKLTLVLTLFIGVLQELDNHTVKKWDDISARANQSKKHNLSNFQFPAAKKTTLRK